MNPPPSPPLSLQRLWTLIHLRIQRRLLALPAPVRGMLWMALGGLLFSLLNTIARKISMELDPYQAQFLRYFCGLIIMLPLIWRDGWMAYKPVDVKGQFWRGGVHTVGLILWFTALPKIPLADMTAIGFTGPIFIMLGAAWFLGEPMRRDRWIAVFSRWSMGHGRWRAAISRRALIVLGVWKRASTLRDQLGS